ncbi:F-box domain-containing protein [Histoplasma capsulatum]|uniref:F-box domain-containing protein n=1 Tax=Ajellomyces capsulatus TaxID=5037 RepID=A0A8A1M6M3_AJECA|nr:F-box domain-containing protein [Histoplasma capsulatum]
MAVATDVTHCPVQSLHRPNSMSIDDTASDVDVDVDVIPSHPLGVKPSGNALTAVHNIRPAIGSLAVLSDELIMLLLEYLDSTSLLRLGATCKALYAFTRAEELWKALFIENPPKGFSWRGTWHATYLNLPATKIASPDCSHLYADILHRPFHCAHVSLSAYTTNIPACNQIPRIKNLTPAEFQESWTNRPFILTEPVKSWPAYRDWSTEHLLKLYGNITFRAETVDWPLKTYVEYMNNNIDESPLYLFDRSFVEKMNLPIVSTTTTTTTTTTAATSQPQPSESAYTPPTPFAEDLFSVLVPDRPDHRWLIIGPPRSGSTFHKDPNATSAWNAVLRGSKYWIMFPSNAAGTNTNTGAGAGAGAGPVLPSPPGVYVSADHSEVTSPLSIAEWFMGFHGAARRMQGCVEGICRAGEVLHVPSGWWHLVVNLEEEEGHGGDDGDDGGRGRRGDRAVIAITQNFVPRGHLVDVLGFLSGKKEQVSGFRDGVEDPFGLFVERLRAVEPDLVDEALRELEKEKEGRKRKWDAVVKGPVDGDGEGEGTISPP